MNAPWDVLLEETQAFIDVTKVDSPKDAIDLAMDFFLKNPKQTTSFIKDDKGVLTQAMFDKAMKRIVYYFEPDTADEEIYADGYEGFDGGQWGYWVASANTRAMWEAAQDVKAKVERVKGKTAYGWRITVSKPYQAVLDAGYKAAVATSAELAKKGILPTKQKGVHGFVPQDLLAKYRKLSKAEWAIRRAATDDLLERLS